MIDNLKIQNFRLFESLDVQGIKRVNLIVGKNNAGKSALLEALQLYFERFSLRKIIEILNRRQEILNLKTTSKTELNTNHLRNICKDRKFPFKTQDRLLISSSPYYSYEMMLMKIQGQGYRPIIEQDFYTAHNQHINVYISCKFDNKEMSNNSFPITGLFDEATIKNEDVWSIFRGKMTVTNYVPTNGLSDNYALSLWDSISLTSAQDDVIKAFHIIEPKLTGLSFVAADSESNSRIPIIKLNDMPEPIPLKSLGDGMTRLFHLILSLVTAKDGVLLIDEFENGLHWSTQSKAWQLIFTLAAQWNVQVFCTTHSKDCINGFEEIWTQHPQEAAFFRLYRKDNQSHIKTYDLEMLSDAIETETEVR